MFFFFYTSNLPERHSFSGAAISKRVNQNDAKVYLTNIFLQYFIITFDYLFSILYKESLYFWFIYCNDFIYSFNFFALLMF